jgi:hypothetical protein
MCCFGGSPGGTPGLDTHRLRDIFCPWPAAKAVYTYTSEATNNTYTLNTEPANTTAAESFCNDVGGHLACWVSREEQVTSRFDGSAAWLVVTPRALVKICKTMQNPPSCPYGLASIHSAVPRVNRRTSRILNAQPTCRPRWRATSRTGASSCLRSTRSTSTA